MLELRPACENCNQPLPPGTPVHHKPVDLELHALFARAIAAIPPEER